MFQPRSEHSGFLGGLEHNKPYKLVLSTTDSLATLSIYDVFFLGANPLGTVTYGLGNFGGSFGMTGIVAQELATFDSFSVVGTTTPTPTPIPGAAWLLGSGLAGLVAMRRRKK